MATTHKNRVQMTVTGTPGTGTITLNAAASGYQSLASAYGADAVGDFLFVDGTAWEVARDCTYTHSGTTLSRGTLEASSTGSAISLTSAAVVSQILTADRGRQLMASALDQVTGTDANTTMVVNTLYVVDMSAWATADRTYTLPATAAVGDRVGIMISAGDASHELLITAASGDTLNAVAGGTEWSRLFITGEVVIMRCVAADATWVVEHDGRIPCAYSVYLSTNAAAETAATWTDPVTKGGAWTSISNVGSCGSNSKFTARRGGVISIGLRGRNTSQHTAEGQYYGVAAFQSDLTTYQVYAIFNSPGTTLYTAPASNGMTVLAAGGEINFRYLSQDGSRGLGGFTSAAYTAFSCMEVL